MDHAEFLVSYAESSRGPRDAMCAPVRVLRWYWSPNKYLYDISTAAYTRLQHQNLISIQNL